jgi:DNA repair exonuclease SbcCD ATPase subunit
MSYNREKIITEIKRCLDSLGLSNKIMGAEQGFPAIHLICKTQCYAVFFTVIQNGESPLDMYKKAQDGIVKLRDENNGKFPRDLNLVILVDEETPLLRAFKREMLDDRFVCRKFLLSINGNDLNSALIDLPFWPALDTSESISIISDIQTAIKGYDPKLIAHLASYSPGASLVFENICKNEYEFESEKQTQKTDQLLERPLVRIRLKSLSVKNFRGIKSLGAQDIDLSADITFIYGPNGVGKTSIADAIEWGITGQLNRLRKLSRQFEKDSIVNIFSKEKDAEVECHFDTIDPIRRIMRTNTTKQWIGDSAINDERMIIDHVVGTQAPVPDNRLRIEKLQELFRSSHMLSQHDIRSFLDIKEKGPEAKFDILTNMVGAEEYIRFRDKVGTVLKHLKLCSNDLLEKDKSLNREYEDCLERLQNRQNEYNGLSGIVTSGQNPENVAEELLRGLGEIECGIEKEKIEKLHAEEESKYYEFIVIHSQTVIQNKNKEIDDLLIQIEIISNGWAKFQDNIKKINDIKKTVENKKKETLTINAELEKGSENLKQIINKLQLQQIKHSQLIKHFKDLSWLKGNIEGYINNKMKLVKLEEIIISNQSLVKKTEKSINELQQLLNAKKSCFVNSQKLFDEKINKEKNILFLKERFPLIDKRFSEIENIKEKNKQIDKIIGQMRQENEELITKLENAQTQYTEINNAYNRESVRYDELNSFKAKLAELINSDECPLCGRIFKSIDEAKSVIQKHLSNIPEKLKKLTKDINQADKNIVTFKSQRTNISRMIKESETELSKNQSTISDCKKDIFEYISDCNRAGIMVAEDNRDSWKNILEQNLRKNERVSLQLEINDLKESTNILTTDLNKKISQNNESSQQLKLYSMQKESLKGEIQEFEAVAIEKGFKFEELQIPDKLVIQYKKVEEDVKNINGLINDIEEEIKKIEGIIKDKKESLTSIHNDVLTQESYKNQLDDACNKYKIGCQKLDVNIIDFNNSIAELKEKSAKIKLLLSIFDKNRIVLQQFVSLKRITQEIEKFKENENQIIGKKKISKEEIDRIASWISCLDKLESDVVKKQINVVGTHLKQLEPTTQRLYSRLSPHPIFGNVRIKIDDNSRRLDVEAEASSDYKELENTAVTPAAYFSDAQMNMLAITIFLGGALSQRWSGLDTIVIDDPIQQMDEMNVYAFLDLIRGLSCKKQFIIMTCSRDFYLLAMEKLDCLNKNKPGAFSAYTLKGVAPGELKVCCDTKQ